MDKQEGPSPNLYLVELAASAERTAEQALAELVLRRIRRETP